MSRYIWDDKNKYWTTDNLYWRSINDPPVYEHSVLVTVRRYHENTYLDQVVACVVVYSWEGDPEYYVNNQKLTEDNGFKVLAWMPLPEPYKEGNDD